MTKKMSKRKPVAVLGARLKVRGNKRYYAIRELIKLTGLTRRQIDYWAAAELITPTFHDATIRGGKPASLYSAVEALKVLIFSDVKQRGFSLAQIRQLKRNLASSSVRLDEAGSYLLTDGITILYARSENEVVDMLKNNRQMLLVPIHDQIERLKSVA